MKKLPYILQLSRSVDPKYPTVVVHTESYKMLATTIGRNTVDTSRSVFVKRELSILNAKGQLLLAGFFLTGRGTTV